jgi:hypothetical protein
LRTDKDSPSTAMMFPKDLRTSTKFNTAVHSEG